MSIEELTKQQMVLLTMLVSFVVSTATAIVTVSSLDEQNPRFTQTVNQIVERTIERVVPGPSRTLVREVETYAGEDETIKKAIAGVSSQMVVISRIGADVRTTGVLTGSKGLVLTSGQDLSDFSIEYEVRFADNQTAKARPVLANGEHGILALKLEEGFISPKGVDFTTPVLSIGQTILSLGYDGSVGKELLSVAYAKVVNTAFQLSYISGTPHTGGLILSSTGKIIGISNSGGSPVFGQDLQKIAQTVPAI